MSDRNGRVQVLLRVPQDVADAYAAEAERRTDIDRARGHYRRAVSRNEVMVEKLLRNLPKAPA